MSLLGPTGKPISSAQFKKAAAPKALGEAFSGWSGPYNDWLPTMPGGSAVQFNLDQLSLADFRAMRDDYQINMSLSVLTFVMHQMDWHIECEDKKIAKFCEDNLRQVWGQLVRSMSQAFWAGYSPNILQWDNDVNTMSVKLTKIKDLYPEHCEVAWKFIDGYLPPDSPNVVPPKVAIYNGIKHRPFGIGGQTYNPSGTPNVPDIPAENSLWYPLLMENGNMYGRKLLRACFQPWFFSNLMHLFANRYFERFGEPIPVGRAPMEEDITVDGKNVNSRTYMLSLLQQLRARKVVVLPSDRSTTGDSNQAEFDYDIEYLESQMRGADFERYMTRLDEEKTLGLFTPLLVTRTADVGSYNLGNAHLLTYNIMLNALGGDWKQYLDWYPLNRMVDYNFGPNAPRAHIVFRKLGRTEATVMNQLLTALIKQDKIKIDTVELGQMAGLTITEVKEVTAPIQDPPPVNDPKAKKTPGSKTATDVKARVAKQVSNAFERGSWGEDLKLNLGFSRKMEDELRDTGFAYPEVVTKRLYGFMDYWCKDSLTAPGVWDNAEHFINSFSQTLDSKLEELAEN